MPFTLIKSFINLFIHSRERLKEKKKRKTKSIATLFEAEFFFRKTVSRQMVLSNAVFITCVFIIHFFISIFLLILLKTLLVLLFSLFECSGPYYKHKKIPIVKFP